MASHKESAIAFLTMVTNGNIREAYEKYVRPDMRHHNPYFTGDAKTLEAGMQENDGEFPDKLYEIKNVIAEGDLVAVHAHLRMTRDAADTGMVTCHIMRFAGDKIVEFWDMAQPIPKDSPNKNGMF